MINLFYDSLHISQKILFFKMDKLEEASTNVRSQVTIYNKKTELTRDSAGMLNFAIIQPVIPYIIEINSYIRKFNLGFIKLI